ncbi:hypothetical protein M9Y10_016684 [Tritrichomonas musculus]|uniref:ATPase dynein-related AAA domain-containing protein n=1 Tax=Tritrichomonas musculus TaxID=1915356 RepID=A0ABR2HWU3_9EUKA
MLKKIKFCIFKFFFLKKSVTTLNTVTILKTLLYKITKKFASQNNASSAVTLYDINKYILFRKVTKGYFHEDLISQMLFGYRFLQQETINQVLEKLGLLKMVCQPNFIFNIDRKELYVKESDEQKEGLTLPIHTKPNNSEIIYQELRTLTIEQQQCLLFLTCAVLSKRVCIIQGSTASGKSHIIRLFANMLGQKISVYQMNSDSDMSILTGQSVLRNEITEKDKKEFQIAFSDLQIFDEFKTFIKDNFSIPHREWKPKQFSNLLTLINNYIKEHDVSEEERQLLKRTEKKITQTMSTAKRFHHEESAFIKAMEKGEWVVFEDLGSAPPEIEEKLSSLCGDDPEIYLFECGENYFFSRNKPNSRKIHDNFQLFITYDPSSKTSFRALDPNFLNKCISFTLPPLDSTTKSSSEIMRGSLKNYKYEHLLAFDLGKRISNVHQFIKKDCQNDKDSYATDSQFTARTLTFILKEFDRHIKKYGNEVSCIYKVLCRSFHLYYMNSYIDKDLDQKRDQMLNEFSKEIDKADFDVNLQGVDQKEKYEYLLIDLRNIQLYVSSNNKDKKFVFEFNEFIRKCMNVQLIDISFIYDHLKDTLEIIKESCSIKDNKNWPVYETLYTQVQILYHLFQSIKNEMPNLDSQYLNMTINNIGSQKLPNFEKQITSVYLLFKLTKENFFYPTTPYMLYDEEIVYLLTIIYEMAQNPNKSQFDSFMSILKENHYLFHEIEKIFPYHLFKDKSHPFYMILYWIPLFKELYEHKITFRIEIIQSYDFVFSSKYSGIVPTYIFKEEDSLNLSAGSEIYFPASNKSINLTQKMPKTPWSKIFYGLTNKIFTNKSQTYHDFISKEKFEKYKTIKPKYLSKDKYANQFLYLAKFYQLNPDVPLISKIWPIIF